MYNLVKAAQPNKSMPPRQDISAPNRYPFWHVRAFKHVFKRLFLSSTAFVCNSIVDDCGLTRSQRWSFFHLIHTFLLCKNIFMWLNIIITL